MLTNIDFFKQQAKRFLKDYNSRVFDEHEGFYEYTPRYFHDIDSIIDAFDISEDSSFTLMNAQHIIARLSGFYKWNELIKASEPMLELGKLLLTNRKAYEEKQGFFTDMVESLIVYDWKSYEKQYLENVTDESKLEVFKMVFLGQDIPQKRSSSKTTFDFSNDDTAQDMLKKIMIKKNLPPEKALLSSITQKNCISILTTEGIRFAIAMWGHDDPYAPQEKLESPLVEVKLSKDKAYLLHTVMEQQNFSYHEAILAFMLFTLESYGYHI